MSVASFVEEARADPRIVCARTDPPRPASFADPADPLTQAQSAVLAARGIRRLYSHQARALDLLNEGRDVLLATGPASGKSLAYVLPIVAGMERDPASRALLLFPTKALARDQLRAFRSDCPSAFSGVFDGDTPGPLRRRIRDRAAVVLSNPDMVHAALLPSHARWGGFLARLRYLVLDEIHAYTGVFGSNVGNVLRRLLRVCRHHGSDPRIVAATATIGNPHEHATRLTGRSFALVDEDGSPRGRRTWLFLNPPRERSTRRRSRRSANVVAHEVMGHLLSRGIRTIAFSKARVTAELIHRYVSESLPELAGRISPYRGGLLPEERREIEGRLFSGDLLGVSTTRALELGIDVGGLDAAILVGWPGTVASFRQQGGRAGRRAGDSLVILIGLDTATNQFVLRHPEYVFDRPVEHATADPENPFVALSHLRCAAHELPLGEEEVRAFGDHGPIGLDVLEEAGKVRFLEGRWFHAATEVPQHEVSLREATDRNFLVIDVDSGRVLSEVGKFDAQSVLHPGAIYLHLGETYRVERLDLRRSVAEVRRVEVDYYTQALGGDDVHHVDRVARERPFGIGRAGCGEVTAYYRVHAYEKVRFYTLDAVSRHGVRLPTWPIDTFAFWIEPPEDLLAAVRAKGLDPASGLSGIGFALRMMMPLFTSADVLDLSHSVGSANTSWRTLFVWEHYPRGLGATAKGYDRLGEIVPAVRDVIEACDCGRGCPRCVGKPLHPYTVMNPERGEGSIPDRRAALAILEGLLGDGTRLDLPDDRTLGASPAALRLRLARALRRRLDRMREPDVLHRVAPDPPRGEPRPEPARSDSDAAARGRRRKAFRKRLDLIRRRGGIP